MHANLALSISISELHYNSTLLQLIIYSNNTHVELSLKYMMYRNEHRSGKNLTTLSLPFITIRDNICITSI